MSELRNIEIFAVGKHNGDTYTAADLDAMVEAFSALDFKPAVRVGHASPDENESATPAIGWIENLRRDGDKLVADFTNMADDVMAMIRRKAFTRVSAEVFWNFERAGRKFSRVLKAVALLGVGIPGVAGLKPLAASFVADLFGEAKAKAYTADLEYPQAKEPEMDQKDVERISREAASAAAAEVTKKFEQQLADEKTAREAAEKKHAEDMKAQQKQFAEAEALRNADRIKNIAATCKLPALRPYIAAFASMAMAASQEKKYSLGTHKVDGKEVPLEMTSLEAVEKFVADINTKVERLYKETGATHVTGANDDPAGEKAYLDSRAAAGAEVDKRVKELQGKDSKLAYEDATQRVLDADPELKAAYTAREKKAA